LDEWVVLGLDSRGPCPQAQLVLDNEPDLQAPKAMRAEVVETVATKSEPPVVVVAVAFTRRKP